MVTSIRNSVVVASLLGSSLPGAPLTHTEADLEAARLIVNLYNHAGAPEATLAAAKVEAGRILGQAGIETDWAECAVEEELIPRYPNCRAMSRAALVLRIIPRSMARPQPTNPAAFGLALVPQDGSLGRFASVYIEAAGMIAGDDEAFGARMLGHLIAHELGHLLLGRQSHSRRGIMQADWLEKDLKDARQGRLDFTPQQAKQMRRSVERRVEELGGEVRTARR